MIARLVLVLAVSFASVEAWAQPATACRCSNSSSSTVCGVGGYAPALQMLGRWKPANQVVYHLATSDSDMQLPGPTNTPYDANAVRDVIQASANTWNNAPCCCTDWSGPGGTCKTGANSNPASHPNVQLIRAGAEAGPITIPADGIEPANNYVGGPGPGGTVLDQTTVIKRIWVSKRDYANTAINFHATPGTLAITALPKYTVAPNFDLQKARMAINGSTFNLDDSANPALGDIHWFITPSPPSGCTNTNRCYSLLKTVVHEFGHFIGYLHSSCSLSVMVPTATANDSTRTSLHETDVKSVCSLTSDGSSTPGNGYGQSAACGTTGTGGTSGSSGMTNTPPAQVGRFQSCVTDANCTAGLKCASGSCDIPCTKNTDCPGSEICPSTGNKYCTLDSGAAAATGVSGTGGSGGDALLPTPDFCAPCKDNADCAAAVCVKLSETARICSTYCSNTADCGASGKCSATTSGEGVCIPTDTTCVASAASRRGALNEVCDAENACGPDLICVQLPGSAVCLEYCDTDAARADAKACSNDGQACYELDKNLKFGACFKASMREGESCLLPDTSLCGLDLKKKCTFLPGQSVDNSACYKLCDTATACGDGQTCTVGSSFGVCTPLPTQLCPLFDYGEKCAKADDCASNLCITRGGDQACSRTCTVSTQSGCPQNFTCQEAGSGDKGYCWPSNNVTKTPAACTTKQACGGCSSGGNASSETLLLSALLFAIAWRRRSSRGKR